MDDMIEDIKILLKRISYISRRHFFLWQNSFKIQLNNETKTISWDDITLIKAYKIDNYTIDRIVIEIHLGRNIYFNQRPNNRAYEIYGDPHQVN